MITVKCNNCKSILLTKEGFDVDTDKECTPCEKCECKTVDVDIS